MSRPARSARCFLVCAVAGLLATVALVRTAGATAATSYSPGSYADRLLSLVNDARIQHGVRPLVLAPGTTLVASAWTEHLAAARVLSHNQQLGRQLSTHGSSQWRTYGENVGVGAASDPDGLFAAYMHSPEHRANILDRDYRYVGVAVVFDGSRSWNTFDFVDAYGAARSMRPDRHTEIGSHPRSGGRAAAAVVHRPTHTRPVVVRVEGERRSAARQPAPRRATVRRVELPRPRAELVAAPPLVHASGRWVADVDPSPGGRTRLVSLAVAMWALTAATRRWMLAAIDRRA